MREIVVVGAGGFGREVAWTLQRAKEYKLLGFADDGVVPCAERQILGPLEVVLQAHPQAAYFIAIGNNVTRARLFKQLESRVELPTLIDPTALVAPDAVLGAGVFVGIGAVVSCAAKVGYGVIINTHCGVGHDVVIEDFAQLCPGVHLSGGTHVGEEVLVGTNACTVPGVTIGAKAKVAAALAVYTDLPPCQTLSPFGSFKCSD